MIDRVPKLLLQILQNRFELLSLELQEEKIQFIQLFLMTAIATTFGLVGFLGLGILIVWLLPPDTRAGGAIALIAIILIVSVVHGLIVIRMARRHTPFETTIATLRKDVQES